RTEQPLEIRSILRAAAKRPFVQELAVLTQRLLFGLAGAGQIAVDRYAEIENHLAHGALRQIFVADIQTTNDTAADRQKNPPLPVEFRHRRSAIEEPRALRSGARHFR